MALDVIAASENTGQSQSSVFELSSTDKLIHTAPAGSGFYDLVYVSYVGARRLQLQFDIQNSSSVSMQSGNVWLDDDEPFLLNPQQSLYLASPGSSTPSVLVRVERSTPDGATVAVEITTNGDSPALEVPGGTTKDLNIHDSAGADVGTRTGDTVEIADADLENSDASWTDTVEAEGTKVLADMTLDFPDSTTESIPTNPGGTVTLGPEFVFIPESGASSGSFITPVLDDTFSVSAQSIDGGGSISNIVIDGAAAVSSFVGASFSSSVVVTFDISGTVNSVTLTF